MAHEDGEVLIVTKMETDGAKKDLRSLLTDISKGADKLNNQVGKISNSLDSFFKSFKGADKISKDLAHISKSLDQFAKAFNQYAKTSSQQMRTFNSNAQKMQRSAEKLSSAEKKQAIERQEQAEQEEAQQKRRAAGREAVRREQERLLEEEKKATQESQKQQQYESTALENAKKAIAENKGQRITNQTPQEIQQEIESLTKYGNAAKNANEMALELAKAKHEVSSLEKQGKWFGDEEYDKAHQELVRIQTDIKEYQKTLEVAPKPENPFGLDTIEGKLKEAQIELSRLLNSGKGIESPEVQAAVKNVAELTEQYKTMYKESSKTEAQKQKEADKAAAQAEREAAAKERAAAAAQRQAEREAARAQKLSEIAEKENAELIHAENLKMIAETADVADQHVIELNKELQDLEARQKLLKEAGVGNMGFSEFAENADRIREIKEELKGVNKEAEPTESIFDRIKQKISEAAQNMLEFGSASRRSNSSVGAGFGKLIRTVLRYGFAIRSTYILVNKLKAFTKEGLKNMALYSSSTNAAISSMLTALNTLKNSLGAAFAPIVETVAPYITSLINMLAGAVTSVNQFISALLGRSTYTKAIVVQQDYAASLNKTADAADKAAKGSENAGKAAKKAAEEEKKFLAGFDEIEKIPEQDKSSSSGSGSGGSGSGSGANTGAGQALQFVTESIPGLVNNWADMLKEAWNKADFTEIGGVIGQKVESALDGIQWDATIKPMAQKVAKSIATLLNGFLETEGLSTSVGNTVAEAFNTGFEFVNTFLENFHFDSFGSFISSGIQAAIERFDWKQIPRTLSNSIIAVLDFGQGFLDGVDWSKFGSQVYTALRDIVVNIEYKKIADKLFELLGTALDDSQNAVSGFFSGLGEDIEKAITDETGKVSWEKIGNAIVSALIAEIDLTKPVREFAKKFPAMVPDMFKDAFKGLDLAEQVLNALSPLKEQKSWSDLAESVGKGFKYAFDHGAEIAKAIVDGIKKYLSGLTFDINPLDGDGIGIKESITLKAAITGEIEKVVDKVPADQKKIDNVNATAKDLNWAPNAQKDLTGIRGKADSVNWAPGSQRDLSINANTKKVDVKDKNVSVNAKDGGKVDVANKDVSVNAKTGSVGWTKNAKQTLSGVTAKATKFEDAIKPKNKTVTVTVRYKKTKSSTGRSGTGGGGSFAKGGVLQHGVWHDIPQYAGGSLNAGSMFVAGERGPEVVGHIGGRTEVLNKSQIASAIYQAMVSAMAKMGGYFSQMTSALANIPPAIQTLSMTQPDFVLEVPQMATGTVLPPQATISTRDAQMLRDALVGLTTALQGAHVSGQQGTTQNNITLELPGVGVLGRAMVKYIDGEAKQGRYPLSGYM